MSSRIAESELILNKDGSIYHLNLHPEDIAAEILFVGDPERVPKVSKYFDRIEIKKEKREFVTHTGTFGGKRMTVLSTGIGTDNIDIVMNELDALVNIDLKKREEKPTHTSLKIIRMGTTGALQPDIPVDSLVVGAYGVGLDNVLQFYERTADEEELRMAAAVYEFFGFDKIHIMPYAVRGNDELRSVFSDYYAGITMTSSGFYGPQGRQLRLKTRLPGWIDKLEHFKFAGWKFSNFEMETSAIYGLGKLLGHQCISVNTVIANRTLQAFSQDPGKAVDRMIRSSLERVSDQL